jgi:hypothetical protein
LNEQIKEQARYYQVFTYEVVPEGILSTKDQMQSAGTWLALGEEEVRSRILVGMTTLADALAYDLGCFDLNHEAQRIPSNESNQNPPSAQLIADDGQRKWFRLANGEISIVDMK